MMCSILRALTCVTPLQQSGSVVTAKVTGTSSGNGLQLLGGAALASNQKVRTVTNNTGVEQSRIIDGISRL